MLQEYAKAILAITQDPRVPLACRALCTSGLDPRGRWIEASGPPTHRTHSEGSGRLLA